MAVVGDVAGALFDLKTGNPLGAAQLGDGCDEGPPPGDEVAASSSRDSRRLRGPCAARPCRPTRRSNRRRRRSGKSIDLGEPPRHLEAAHGAAQGAEGRRPETPALTRRGPALVEGGGHLRDDGPAPTVDRRPGRSDDRPHTTTTTSTTHEPTSGWRGSPVEAGATARARRDNADGAVEPRTPAPAVDDSTARRDAHVTSQRTTPAPRGDDVERAATPRARDVAAQSTPAASTAPRPRRRRRPAARRSRRWRSSTA